MEILKGDISKKNYEGYSCYYSKMIFNTDINFFYVLKNNDKNRNLSFYFYKNCEKTISIGYLFTKLSKKEYIKNDTFILNENMFDDFFIFLTNEQINKILHFYHTNTVIPNSIVFNEFFFNFLCNMYIKKYHCVNEFYKYYQKDLEKIIYDKEESDEDESNEDEIDEDESNEDESNEDKSDEEYNDKSLLKKIKALKENIN